MRVEDRGGFRHRAGDFFENDSCEPKIVAIIIVIVYTIGRRPYGDALSTLLR